jgi:4-amino-4-deoxy-L-arabinose transferase-like glycosyltransferase
MSTATLEARKLEPVPTWRLVVASFLPTTKRDAAQRWIRLIPVALILLTQAALTLRLSNSAFRDEALYIWTGHREIAHLLHGAVLYDKPESYFSGSPRVYPVIAAMLDWLGGLTLVRLLSLAFMLTATAAIYSFSKRLFSPRVGLLAAAAFALTGPTMHLGQFATFDAMALSLIAMATAIGVRAVQTRSVGLAVVVSGLVTLAVVTKYASLLFVPFALCAVALTPARRAYGLRVAAMSGIITCAALASLAATIGRPELAGVRLTTTNRSAIQQTSPWLIAQQTWHYVGPWYVVSVVGLLVVAVTQRRILLPVLLMVATITPAVYQAHIHEGVSLDKHLDFGLVFGAPLIGLAGTVTRATWQRVVLGVAAAWLAISGLVTSRFLFNEWSNSTPLTDVMSYAFHDAPYIRTLGDVYEPARYHFEDSTQYWQWDTTDSIFYHDRVKGDLRGIEAAKAGLHARYWQYVYLDGSSTGISRQLIPLMSSYGYKLTDTVRLTNNSGGEVYYVWQNFDPPPAT